MGKSSYLRFNPETREIEIEGSEKFVKDYFDKLQQMLPQEPGAVKKGSETLKIVPTKAAIRTKAKQAPKAKAEIPAPKKVAKVASKKVTAKKSIKVSLIDQVVGLIQDSKMGITTAELTGQTGLAARQIWGITNQASKAGKIKTAKRGVYVPI